MPHPFVIRVILVKLVDEYLYHKGYFTRHNIKFNASPAVLITTLTEALAFCPGTIRLTFHLKDITHR